MSITAEQARTLAAVVDTGSFERAARLLHLTPSAVSQRIRALENALGAPAVRRSRPVGVTDAGSAVLRYARRTELLTSELAAEVSQPGLLRRLSLVVNADSLHTWVLPALAGVADEVQLDIIREDQDHSTDLLRSGDAAAAITTEATAVPGCHVTRLGTMRYLPMATHRFADRWFADGVTATTLASAPMIVYDRRDDLQDRFLRRFRRAGLRPPRHHIPATAEYAEAIRLGMGWGMMIELQLTDDDRQRLRPLVEGARLDVALHWQRWKGTSPALDLVTDAVVSAARLLR